MFYFLLGTAIALQLAGGIGGIPRLGILSAAEAEHYEAVLQANPALRVGPATSGRTMGASRQ